MGKSNTFCIGSYCTAGSFCLLVISHCSNKKKDVSLRVYLFAKEGQVSSRPEIWPWTVLSLSAACQPVLPKLSCRNACLCIAWPLCTVLPSLFSVLRIHACSFTWQVLDCNQHWALAVVPYQSSFTLAYWGMVGLCLMGEERGRYGPAAVGIFCHSWPVPHGLCLTPTC